MTRALQQKIHIGCRQLGLDQDARRDLQLAVCGKASMRDMNESDMLAVVKRLEENGFKPSSKPRSKHKRAPRADLRLVHVLWGKLRDAGALKNPDRKGLNAFVRTRFEQAWGSVPDDVDMLRDHQQIDDIIQALLSWCDRVGAEIDYDRIRR